MSDLLWIGEAPAVAQVSTIAITAYDVGTTYSIIVGGVSVSTIAAGSANATATALAAAWNTSTHAYLTGVTALASTSNVALTADVAGVPFVVTTGVAGGTGTMSNTATTASSGPNDYSTAANWSTGAVPANGDKVYFRNSSVPVLWGLAQSGVAPALLVIEQTYTGTIGLPYASFTTSAGVTNPASPEYRQAYLATAATTVRVGENYSSQSSTGASLLKLDLGSANATIEVFNTGSSSDGLPPFLLKTNHASAALKVYNGSIVGLGYEQPADTSTIGEIDVYPSGNGGGAEVFVGANVTQTTHRLMAGSSVLRNAPTSVYTENGANLTLAGSGTITTLQSRGGLSVAGAYTITNLQG